MNFLLGYKLANSRGRNLEGSRWMLEGGARLPPLELRDERGRSVVVDYRRKGTPLVLYIVRRGCGWCERNVPNIRSLARQVSGQYEFIGISLGSEREGELRYDGYPFPIYRHPSECTKYAYRLVRTPATIVMSPTAGLLKAWYGAYVGKRRAEIESYFHVRLPREEE